MKCAGRGGEIGGCGRVREQRTEGETERCERGIERKRGRGRKRGAREEERERETCSLFASVVKINQSMQDTATPRCRVLRCLVIQCCGVLQGILM